MGLKRLMSAIGLSAGVLLAPQVMAADQPTDNDDDAMVSYNHGVDGVICLKGRKPLVVSIGLGTTYTAKNKDNFVENDHPNVKTLGRVTDDVVKMWKEDIRPHYTFLFQKAAAAGTLDRDIKNPDSNLAAILGFVLVPKVEDIISKHKAADIVFPSISMPHEVDSAEASALCQRLTLSPT